MRFDIKYFAKLARIKLTPAEEKKFSKDIEQVLDHFRELQEIDTSEVEPMTGGTGLRNVLREDEVRAGHVSRGTEQFPEKKDDFLKVPKVFE